MDMVLIIGLAIILIAIMQLIAIIVLFSKNRQSLSADVSLRLAEYVQSLEKNEAVLRDEFGKNREETNKSARDSREELSSNLKSASEQLSAIITNFTGLVDHKLSNMQEFMDSGLKDNREELSAALKAFEEKSSAKIEALTKETKEELEALTKETREELEKNRDSVEKKLADILQGNEKKLEEMRETTDSGLKYNREGLSVSIKAFEEKSSAKIEALTKETKEGLEKTRDSVEKKLDDILQGNEKKLEEMRQTVDEKLHRTLETRLGESFKLVKERLELVQKSLGEMQTLANEIGSVKNVLSNVKNKGVLGEYQLEAILEQILTPEQYAQSVETKEGSGENVEFAVKIPSKEDSNRIIWLPIDAKFPTSDYEILLDAYEKGEREGVIEAQKELEAKIEKFAQNIHQKYINPPNTTEFGIMFLPFEGLYAEVLRIPGLFENIQNTYKVTITGPTTISAFLNSLQMGFRSLVVEKRTSEIWDLLGAVKTEFGKFGTVLQKTKEKLSIALNEIDNADTRSRAIEKKLRDVQTLPEAEAQKLLSDVDADADDVE